MGRRSHQDISDEQGNVSKKTEEEFKEKQQAEDYWTPDSIYVRLVSDFLVDPRKKITYEVVYPESVFCVRV